MMSTHQVSVRRACEATLVSVSGRYYRPRLRSDEEVIEALNATVGRYPRWGFWKCYDRLRLDGHAWNHKRVHRVYCALRLNLPRRRAKRHAYRNVSERC